jgi:hypothetical protein
MTDEELVAGLEGGTLPPERFGHREHLRVAWFYRSRYGRDQAERKLVEELRSLARRAGKPDRFDAALTRAWVAALDDAAVALGGAVSFDELLRARPALLDRTAVRAFR